MKNLDRVIMILLAGGIWALVLQPDAPRAHSGQACLITSATGYGEVEDTSVSIHDGESAKLVNNKVRVHKIEGGVVCN